VEEFRLELNGQHFSRRLDFYFFNNYCHKIIQRFEIRGQLFTEKVFGYTDNSRHCWNHYDGDALNPCHSK
jgi:hypothetical protein